MKVIICLICTYSAVVARSQSHKNNVCPTNLDYNTINTNKKCWYNSDVDLNVTEIIKKYGYPFEEYEIITNDGYKLPLYRIPHSKYSKRNPTNISQPVFFQHGLICSCAPWVTYGNKSLGFILADEGYDVWLANSRGSTYAKAHVNLSIYDKQFWNFSYHEIAVYDVPKSLDFIYEKTGRNDIIVIGISLGTNIQLAYASELPEHAKQRVKYMVYMGPTAFLLNLKSLPSVFTANLWPTVYRVARNLGLGEILSKDQFPTQLNTLFCTQSGIQAMLCQIMLLISFGDNAENFSPEILPVILGHFPGGTTVKTIIHLSQNLVSGKFCRFDYGYEGNEIAYNSTKPPDYDVSKIMVPGLIMYGANDFLVSPEGLAALLKGLPKGGTIRYEIKNKQFGHLKLIYSENVVTQVINPMLSYINMYKTSKFIQKTTGN